MDIYVVKINDTLRRVSSDLDDIINYVLLASVLPDSSYNEVLDHINIRGRFMHCNKLHMVDVEVYREKYNG